MVEEKASTIAMTKIKELTEGLKSSEKYSKHIQELGKNISDIVDNAWIWLLDDKGKFAYSNSVINDFLGYKPKELIGKSPFDLMKKKEDERYFEEMAKAVKEGDCLLNYANKNMNKQGKEVELITNMWFIFKDSKIVGVVGIDKLK